VLENGSFSGVDLDVDFTEEGIIRNHEIEDPPAAAKEVSTTAAPSTTQTSGSTTGSALVAAIPASPALAIDTAAFTATKPLTPVQVLHKDLNICKKKYAKSKKKMLSCEAQARKAYAAKIKKTTKKK
jgi:hypothetical protein